MAAPTRRQIIEEALVEMSMDALFEILGNSWVHIKKVWPYEDFMRRVPAILEMEEEIYHVWDLEVPKWTGKSDFQRAFQAIKTAFCHYSMTPVVLINPRQIADGSYINDVSIPSRFTNFVD